MRKRTALAALAPTAVGLGVSAVVWSRMPDPMPIHWDAHGHPNGWAPKAVGLLFAPVLGVAVSAVTAWGMGRGSKSHGLVDGTALGIGAFHLGLHALVIQAALHPGAELTMTGVFGLTGALLIGVGLTMPHLSQNRVAGVRTPWTLSDEVNWRLTHRFAAWSMGVAGALTIAFALVLSPPATVWASLAAILVGSFLPLGYSYVIHRMRR